MNQPVWIPIVKNDHFEPETYEFNTPCCWCKHRHGEDTDQPCADCGHNGNNQ